MENIKCAFNKNCTSVCTQQQCKNYPFLCNQDDCQCYISHTSCYFNIRWKTFKESINKKTKSKTIQINNYISSIELLFQQTMKNLSSSYEEFRKQSESVGLSHLEKEFLNKIKENDTKQFTGSYIKKILQQSMADISLKALEFVRKQIYIQTQKLVKIFNRIFLPVNERPQLQSKITSDIPTLLSFFKPIKVNNFKLLYRASQNNFSTDKFHELCDNIPNTLIIAKTQFGKIIGGYTPLLWDKNKHNQEQTDIKKESFLFSLSLKQKIPISSNYDKAIKNYNGFGPVFGSGQCFFIIDKANENTRNRFHIDDTSVYKHKDFGSNQESYLKLCGQIEGSRFRIWQWEVFEVKF